jgi:hypothetical protein
MQEFPMTTHNNTSTAAQETSARLATLDPSAGRITTINTYTVTPERAEEVLEYLACLSQLGRSVAGKPFRISGRI